MVLVILPQTGQTAPSSGAADSAVSAASRLGLGDLLELDGVLFCVCDQPWLRRDSVERLLADFAAHPDRICALGWRGERGSPAVFPRELFPELLALSGDRGGGGVLRAHRERLRLTEAGGAEELRDVDEAGTAASVICVKRTEILRQTDKF